MTKLLALMSLAAISFGMTLGNYWITFGLWPKSWWAFIGFAIGQGIISQLSAHVVKADSC